VTLGGLKISLNTSISLSSVSHTLSFLLSNKFLHSVGSTSDFLEMQEPVLLHVTSNTLPSTQPEIELASTQCYLGTSFYGVNCL
jgi:hypothetical protein